MNTKDLQRFFSKVKRHVNGCWEWQAGTYYKGYGKFYLAGSYVGAHVAIFEHVFGYKPICTCHRCDNSSCCNPFHLYGGTYKTNRIDAHVRKQVKSQKLSVEAVLEIRKELREGKKGRNLATLFGVSEQTICDIKHRRIWEHLRES